jgi:hypothetical protein
MKAGPVNPARFFLRTNARAVGFRTWVVYGLYALEEAMSLRWERGVALAAITAILAGTPALLASKARAENNVAPALVLRQQASDGATAPAVKAMQQAMADATQSQPQGANARTEAK